MKLDKHIVDMFTELTKPADDVKMEKTCYGTISVVDGTRYVKLDGSDLLVPAASTVKTSHGDRVTVLMKNHSLTVTGNLTAPATDGEGGSSGEAGTAATIEVGTVTTGEAGSSVSVTNSGTTSAAVFDFVIPRGDKGDKGDTGPQGPQGEKGDTGTWDGTIPDHEHTVSDITDFPTSLPANGGNANTLDGKHASDFVQKSGDSMSGNLRMETNQLWFGTGGITQFRFENTNGVLNLKNHDGTTIFSANYGESYATHADKLDGKHASEFMQSLGCPGDTNFMNDANYKVNYHCNIGDGTLIGLPLAGWYHIVYYMDAYPTGYGMQIAYPLNFDGATMIRRAEGTTWGDWKNVADGGNATTLEAHPASDFLYANGFAGQLANLFSDSTAENPIFSTVPDDATLNSLSSGIYAVNTSAARTSLGIPPIVSSGYPSGVSADNYIKPGGILIKLGTVLPGPGYQYQRGFCDSNVPVCCAFFIENNGGMYMAYGYLHESSMRWNWRGFCMDYYSEPSPIAIRAIVYLKKDVVVTSNTPYEIYNLDGNVIIPYTAGIAYGPTRQYSLKRGTSSVSGRPCFLITTAGTLPAGRYLLSMH